MGDEFVREREFERYVKSTDRELSQLRRAVEALEQQRDKDLEAAAERRKSGIGLRIAAVGAGAAVVAAWVAVLSLWHSSGR